LSVYATGESSQDQEADGTFFEKVEDVGGAKACNFCPAKDENVKNKMISCSRFYCSKRCQKWDWTVANHKLVGMQETVGFVERKWFVVAT
jgi:endogenous inhibitor of DNA gyrase (YacG/DUF329 family)